MPPRDKIRPWLWIYCRFPGCNYECRGEFEGLIHQDENPCHEMDWPGQEFRRQVQVVEEVRP